MGKAEDLSGKYFNQLYVLSLNEEKTKEKKYRCYNVLCSCGKITIVRGSCLKSGHTKSCGCLREKTIGNLNKGNFNNLTKQHYHKLTALFLDEERTQKERCTYWFFQCDCGNIKSIKANNVLNGSTKSCGCIKTSYGEEKIEKILKEYSISYQKEYIFKDLISPKGEYFRYDFAIFKNDNLAYLIEFHGEQHYKPNSFFDQTMPFEIRQKYDRIKEEYCKNKKIPLIILKYSDFINKEDVIKEEFL